MSTGRNAKARLKRAMKMVFKSIGAAGLFHGPSSRILTYHSIGNRSHEMNVLPGDFARQMEWLAAQGIVIPLAAAAEGKPGVALTFDDGFVDNLRNAAPILCRFGLPATVFMVAGKAGESLTPDEAPESSRLMNWDELRELASLGVEIGAHTMTHRRLSRLTPAEQKEEIFGCKSVLESHLHREIAAFAYPYGAALDYDRTSQELVRQAGFRFAVSNRYGANGPAFDRWALRRIWVDATDDLPFFMAKVQGELDGLTVFDSTAGIHARRIANRLLQVDKRR